MPKTTHKLLGHTYAVCLDCNAKCRAKNAEAWAHNHARAHGHNVELQLGWQVEPTNEKKVKPMRTLHTAEKLYACSYCGAGKGEPCVASTGMTVAQGQHHTPRRRAWNRDDERDTKVAALGGYRTKHVKDYYNEVRIGTADRIMRAYNMMHPDYPAMRKVEGQNNWLVFTDPDLGDFTIQVHKTRGR